MVRQRWWLDGRCRRAVLIDASEAYCRMARDRNVGPLDVALAARA